MHISLFIENKNSDLGILICGVKWSGYDSNKYKTVRAALCWNEELAVLAKQHNNANIVCPARFISKEEALLIIESL